MPKKLSKPPEMIEDVLAEIEDTLPDLTVYKPELKAILHSKPRNQLLEGYYVLYQISAQDIERAVYLGNTVKELKRNFTTWSKAWRV